jgi:predicted hotdog family 3-hydroxylacyl-ACP dehydratase
VTLLDRAWLLGHLPHQGEMNLLEAISAWDASTLRASATSHRSPTNPLRRAGELPTTAGIEYGAQAAAAHGALLGEGGAGLLASVRAVRMHVRRLDDLEAPLEILAEQLGGGAGGVLYRFELTCNGAALIEGRVTVAFT